VYVCRGGVVVGRGAGGGEIVDEEEEQEEEAWRCCWRRPLFAAVRFGADQLYKGTRPTTFCFFFFVLGATMDPSRAFIKDAKRVVVKVRWLCLLFAFFSLRGGPTMSYISLYNLSWGSHRTHSISSIVPIFCSSFFLGDHKEVMISTALLFLSVNLVYITFFYYKIFSVNVNFLFLAEDEEIGHNRIIKIDKVRSGFLGTTFDVLLLLLPQLILSLDQNNSGENSLY